MATSLDEWRAKFTAYHPEFCRIQREADFLVTKAGLAFEAQFLKQNPMLAFLPEVLQEKVAKAEGAMRSRLYRELGLAGNYVAH